MSMKIKVVIKRKPNSVVLQRALYLSLINLRADLEKTTSDLSSDSSNKNIFRTKSEYKSPSVFKNI